MPDLLRDPSYRDVFTLHDGETIICHPGDAHRTLDKRNRDDPLEQPQTVWEVKLESGIVRTIWPSELRSWVREEVVKASAPRELTLDRDPDENPSRDGGLPDPA